MTQSEHRQDLGTLAVRGAAWSALDKWLGRILSLITFALLGRLLGPEAFGIVAAAQVVIMLLGVFTNSGLVPALVLEEKLDARTRASGFWLGLLAGLAPATLLLLIAPLAAGIFHVDGITPVLRVMAALLVIRGISVVPEALLLKELHFRAIALRSIVSAVAGSIVGLTMAFSGAGVWALVGQSITQALVAATVMWIAARIRPTFRPQVHSLRRIAKFSGKLLAIELATVVLQYGDNFLVGAILGTTALGYYVIAHRLLSVLQETITGVLDALALPIFARIKADRDRTARAFARATKVSLSGAAPLFLTMLMWAPVLIPLVFGDQWSQSVALFQWLCIAGIVNSVNFFNRSVLYAAGRPGLELLVMGVAAIVTLFASGIGAQYGLTVVAAAIALRAVAISPLRLATLKIAIGIRLRMLLREWLDPVLASIAFAIVSTGLSLALDTAPATLRLALATAAGLSAFAGCLHLRDRTFFPGLIRLLGRLRTS
ncbi:lipopolysaccharide biosynthesis protein [Blastococcus sp. PRF04-17]|uniref:lipopolysaccharide biosynthesis protein n=1 Tax=Blastococcus sp. PRF04-17 TaxID=2933797 RepID=UPI001FF5E3A2|nr:lipopolysaccharide biosynthesis protein [Blastococcus sp. PRF04-17]UOY00226.1 lipopolysaccharide biosynthesis protein [Blastococcus sp. PRF04-17]